MGKIIKKRVEYGGSSNSAENIKYDDTKNVKEAVAEVNSNLEKLPKTKYILEDKSVLSIVENGKYYCLNAKDLPANEDTYGYLDVTVHPNDSNYRVIRYTPINSNDIHQNVLHNGTWQGWKSFAKNSDLVKRDGSSNTINPVSDVNNFYSGIGLFNGATNTPSQDYWLILSSGYDGTVTQVAYSLWNSVTPKTRFCAARDWSEWKDLKQEQIDSIINNLNNKIKVAPITGSTGTGGGSGLLNVPRTDYPNAIAIIPFGYDHTFSYRVGAYDISSENFKFGVQLAVSGAWAENVTITFNALVIE